MSSHRNTIFVTGASGTIGRELIAQLQGAGADLIAGTSSGRALQGVTTRRADLTDRAGLTAAFQGVDTLFLLLPLQADMADLARNAIDAAQAAGVKHIVRSSGAGADPDGPAAISRVHGQIDQMVIDSGLAYTLTRPTSFMQNYINFYGAMVREGTLYLPQGDGRVSFIDARDVAAANAAILQDPSHHAGQAYTLTGAEALSNTEVGQQLGAVLGKPVHYVAVPDEAAAAHMRQMGMDDWLVDALMSLNRLIAAGHAAGISPDTERLLGRPPIGFARFAADNADRWRAHAAA